MQSHTNKSKFADTKFNKFNRGPYYYVYSFDTIAEFSNNVIKKVPVTVPYGYMIVDQSGTTNDFLNCSKQVLRTIEFHLKDSRGNYINMHNMNCSFSLVFNKFNLVE